MYISIVEDKEEHARLLSSYLQKYFASEQLEFDLSIHNSADDFRKNCKYVLADIIFMDIYIGHQNGMDIAKEIRESGYQGSLIFCTVTPDYALAGYEVNACGYLLKPYTYESIEKVLNSSLQLQELKNPDIRIKEKGNWYTISTNHIIYAENHGNYIHIHTGSKIYHTRMTMKKLMKQLSVDKRLVQCNSGMVINLANVKEIGKHAVVLESRDGKDLFHIFPSRHYISIVQEQYEHYIFKKAGFEL